MIDDKKKSIRDRLKEFGAEPMPAKPDKDLRKDMQNMPGTPGKDLREGMIKMKKGGSTSKWIQSAINKPGALKKSLGVKKGEKIPAGKLAAAAKKPGKLGQRARLAQTLKGLKK